MRTRSRGDRFFESVLWSAAAVTVYGVAVVSWLLLTGRALPDPVSVIEPIAAFPIFGAATVFRRRYWHSGGASFVSPALARSKAILIGTAAVFVALTVTVLIVAPTAPDVTVPPGEPEVAGGHYVLDNHGYLTPVSRSLYDRAQVKEEDQFVGFAVLFALAAIANLAATGERILARRGPIRSDQ